MVDKRDGQPKNLNTLNLWGRMLSQWGYTYDPPTVTDTITGNVKLGSIGDALDVLISLALSRRDPSELQQDERHALEDFLKMHKKIDELKDGHEAPSEAYLDLLFEDIRDMKGRDPEMYRILIEKVRDFAEKELRG